MIDHRAADQASRRLRGRPWRRAPSRASPRRNCHATLHPRDAPGGRAPRSRCSPSPRTAQDRARTKEIVVGLRRRAAVAPAEHDRRLDDQQPCSSTSTTGCVDRDAKTYKPTPMLATGWKIVNDTTWEFTLRPGREVPQRRAVHRRSPSRRPWTTSRIPPNKIALRSPRWALVKEVQVVNDYTVRFVTEKPWPGLIDRMAATDFLPMPPKALKEPGPPGARREAHRHRAVQVRRSGCATSGSCSSATPTTGRAPADVEPRDLPLHPRVQRAPGRAALGRDRHHEGRAAARRRAGRPERQGARSAPPCPRGSTTWPS